MKLLIITAFAIQVTAVQAVTIQLDNNNGDASNFVADNSGNKIATGNAVIALGYFGNLPDAQISDFSSFVQVGTTYVNFFAGVDGFFDTNLDAGSDGIVADLSVGGADEAAVGKGVFMVIGDNSADITLSSDWLVFKSNQTYTAPPNEGPSTVGLIDGTGTLIQGDFGKFSFNNGSGAPISAFSLVAIPEPSSIALLGLGLVGFTLRRRR